MLGVPEGAQGWPARGTSAAGASRVGAALRTLPRSRVRPAALQQLPRLLRCLALRAARGAPAPACTGALGPPPRSAALAPLQLSAPLLTPVPSRAPGCAAAPWAPGPLGPHTSTCLRVACDFFNPALCLVGLTATPGKYYSKYLNDW